MWCCRSQDQHDEEVGSRLPILQTVAHQDELIKQEQGKRSTTTVVLNACCCISVLLLLLVAGGVGGLQLYLSNKAVTEMLIIDDLEVTEFCTTGLDMSNITYNVWWPGCGYITDKADVTTECSLPCYPPKLLSDMNAFNQDNPGTLLTYPSRSSDGLQDIELTGWWLPAPGATKSTPRVVLQHGFQDNSNAFRQVLMAYMLRDIGISVLVNNFRDHGYSDKSTAHMYEWGHAYPYDVLGAWDYAVKDPHGKLGGAVPEARVGMQGFSKGAFTVMNGFGIEGDAPAMWIDSGPYRPKVVFEHGAAKVLADMGIGFMGSFLVDNAWSRVVSKALENGIDLTKHIPETELPKGPSTKRKVFLVGNTNDDTVPIKETRSVQNLLAEHPDKYDVRGAWINEGSCHGSSHCMDHLTKPAEYKAKLSQFWGDVFDVPA